MGGIDIGASAIQGATGGLSKAFSGQGAAGIESAATGGASKVLTDSGSHNAQNIASAALNIKYK